MLLAIGIGLAISVGHVAAQRLPGSEVWVNAVLWGLALGLRASGLFSGAKGEEIVHGLLPTLASRGLV